MPCKSSAWNWSISVGTSCSRRLKISQDHSQIHGSGNWLDVHAMHAQDHDTCYTDFRLHREVTFPKVMAQEVRLLHESPPRKIFFSSFFPPSCVVCGWVLFQPSCAHSMCDHTAGESIYGGKFQDENFKLRSEPPHICQIVLSSSHQISKHRTYIHTKPDWEIFVFLWQAQ